MKIVGDLTYIFPKKAVSTIYKELNYKTFYLLEWLAKLNASGAKTGSPST